MAKATHAEWLQRLLNKFLTLEEYHLRDPKAERVIQAFWKGVSAHKRLLKSKAKEKNKMKSASERVSDMVKTFSNKQLKESDYTPQEEILKLAIKRLEKIRNEARAIEYLEITTALGEKEYPGREILRVATNLQADIKQSLERK